MIIQICGSTKLGSTRYLAPELMRGDHPKTEASDTYAFAMLVIEVRILFNILGISCASSSDPGICALSSIL